MMKQQPISPVAIVLSIFTVLMLVPLLSQVDWTHLRALPERLDPTLSAEDYRDMVQRHYSQHAIWAMTQQRDVFEWSLRSARYLFWLTVIVGVSGVAFAFWQFARAEQFDRARTEADEMEVKTEMASLSFKARSVAALVLFVSIAYLMIYAAFVYPVQMHDIGGGSGRQGEVRQVIYMMPEGVETEARFSDPDEDLGQWGGAE